MDIALPGAISAGIVAGAGAYALFGSSACPTERALLPGGAGVIGGWAALTFHFDAPGAGAMLCGAAIGYLIGAAAGSIASIVRALRGPGNGGYGRGDDGDDDPEPGPFGPDPEDHTPEAEPEIVELSMADFARETSDNPAPAEPVPTH